MLKLLAPAVAVIALSAFALPGQADLTPTAGTDVLAQQCDGKKCDKPATEQPKPTENCKGEKGERKGKGKKGEGKKGKGKKGEGRGDGDAASE